MILYIIYAKRNVSYCTPGYRKLRKLPKLKVYQQHKSVSKLNMGGGVRKTFHPSLEPNLDSEPSSHVVSQIMVTLYFMMIFPWITLQNLLKNAKFWRNCIQELCEILRVSYQPSSGTCFLGSPSFSDSDFGYINIVVLNFIVL